MPAKKKPAPVTPEVLTRDDWENPGGPENEGAYWGNVDLTAMSSAQRRGLLLQRMERGTLDAYKALHDMVKSKRVGDGDRIRAARTLLEVAGMLKASGGPKKPGSDEGKVVATDPLTVEELVKALKNQPQGMQDTIWAMVETAPPAPPMPALSAGAEE